MSLLLGGFAGMYYLRQLAKNLCGEEAAFPRLLIPLIMVAVINR